MRIADSRAASLLRAPPYGHGHFWDRASRRVFVRGAAGVAAAAFTSGLWGPALARAGHKTTSAGPRPIAPNPDLFGFRVHVPAENSEPSTITDFNGFVAVAEIQGTGTLTLGDGTSQHAFFDVDNRVFSGEFVGLDGRMHNGTFGFTWLDVYDKDPADPTTTQLIDFNPGVDPDTGLFWTVALPDDSAQFSPGSGRARFALEDFATRDFHSIFAGLSGGPSDPGRVSFDQRWGGSGRRAVQTDGTTFAYRSIINTATVEWSGRNLASGASFVSDDRSTSHSLFAAVGHEKNGVFFTG